MDSERESGEGAFLDDMRSVSDGAVAGGEREGGAGEEEKGFIEDGYGRGRATSKGGRTKRKEDWRGRAVEKTG